MLAALLHGAAHGVPVAFSVVVVLAASSVVPSPRGSVGLYACRWVVLSAAATVFLIAAGKLSRRLLPLATLMRLSLVFPDAAPSRFKLAQRSGTVATLEERLADARRADRERTPLEAAQLLLELIAHLDDHDRLTRGHAERVRAYAQSIGRELGLGRRELELLNWAALLHDVGKLDVPHDVLTKAGRPSDHEWELLRRHPEAGAELAAPLRDWLGEWGDAIEQHHERWDGAGYPHGLAGTDISLAGRIVAVADVYDVLTSSRSYKQAGSSAAARQELARCAGTQFDPAVVRAFLSISIRSRGVVTGPLSWLAHAPVLARIPLTPAATVVSAAAVATGVAVTPSPAPAQRQVVEQVVRAAAPGSSAPAVLPSADPAAPGPAASAGPRAADPAAVAVSRSDRPRRQTKPPAASPPHPGSPSEAPSAADPSPPAAAPEAPRAEPSPASDPAPASASPSAPGASSSVTLPPPGEAPRPPELVRPVVEDVVQPVVEGVVQPVVAGVVQPVVAGVVQPVVEGVVQPVVAGAVPPVVATVQPVVGAVPPVQDVVPTLPVVGQVLPSGSQKPKPSPLLPLP